VDILGVVVPGPVILVPFATLTETERGLGVPLVPELPDVPLVPSIPSFPFDPSVFQVIVNKVLSSKLVLPAKYVTVKSK